jgi:hypothetical protein
MLTPFLRTGVPALPICRQLEAGSFDRPQPTGSNRYASAGIRAVPKIREEKKFTRWTVRGYLVAVHEPALMSARQ